MEAKDQLFGDKSSGSAFTVYAPGQYEENDKTETCRNWSFAVKVKDKLNYSWPLDAFEKNRYQLHLHGPNGFFREFNGNSDDPKLVISLEEELNPLTKAPPGNAKLKIRNIDNALANIKLKDVAYQKSTIGKSIPPLGEISIPLKLKASYGWYDFAVTNDGNNIFKQRYAGRIETGKETYSDPIMGRVWK